MLTFAIGDIHGHLDKLDHLLGVCASYAGGREHKHVLLGDHIDRGPDSRGVVRRLIEMTANGDVALYGNHEDMLLAALSDTDEDVRLWIDNGGLPTLNSYGIEEIDARKIPKEHIDWMRKLPRYHDDGSRFYVHAGIDHKIPLHGQNERTMIWTNMTVPPWAILPRTIVHGHFAREDGMPLIRRNSVNLDTGCGFGGPLSAAIFEDDKAMPTSVIVGGIVVPAQDMTC